MRLLPNPGLIPRYNWDYGVSSLRAAVSGALANEDERKPRFRNENDFSPIAISSGRAALYTILKCMGLIEGARIGVSLFCCPVVFDAIGQAGYKPVFVDIDPADFNMLPDDLRRKYDKIDAVIAVHMFGHPVDLDLIKSISGAKPVIEDCAQALYSRYKGQSAGFLADFSFFSFRTGKYLSAGEAAMILAKEQTDREAANEFVRQLPGWTRLEDATHACKTYVKALLYHRPWYGLVGYPVGRMLDAKLNLSNKSGFGLKRISRGNYRLLCDRLDRMYEPIMQQRANALYFLEHLNPKGIILPREKSFAMSNYYQFAVLCSDRKHRDSLADELCRKGIDCAKYLSDIAQVAAAEYGYKGDCPRAEECANRVLVIPHHYALSQRALDQIIERVNAAGNC